ncbi:MAG: peptide chain release factor N(5)-glutamine methyltransferase [Deltaproteobacteria bacterium]|nr:peptide chain release factor N(5)-glutamine methyltransferase [Deltaproteobacteria bacterium]MBW1871133.1 peptide chain release factor N(5)-glutamine methyltransferase [Deltaproteobacteria bacterium]
MSQRPEFSPAPGSTTIKVVLNQAERFLQRNDGQTARLDAEILLGFVLGIERSRLVIEADTKLENDEAEAFNGLVNKRAKHEPVAYLTGAKEFWSMSFKVDPRVLIPRPDTETVLELVQELFQTHKPCRFVDVGCGSACIACGLASLFARVSGVAVDRAEGALSVAKQNIQNHGLSARVETRLGDLLEPVSHERFDIICANLPYIPTAALDDLPLDIKLYEPLTALDGGVDGLDCIRRLISQAPANLDYQGWLIMEVGAGQADQVDQLCSRAGLVEIQRHKDLSGIERVVAAQWLLKPQ